jgi:hypothetical protein
MEAADSSETLLPVCKTKWLHIPENHNLNTHRPQRLKLQTFSLTEFCIGTALNRTLFSTSRCLPNSEKGLN